MKIKRITKVQIGSTTFKVKWNPLNGGGSFGYNERIIEIGTKDCEEYIFEIIVHEISEVAAVECSVRYDRPDTGGDYLFAYDHRIHDIKCGMIASALSKFIA